MSTWPVFVQDWQFECCGERFSVDDEVAWTLVFVPEPAIPTREEMFVEADVEIENTATADDGTSGRIVRIGHELHAWLSGDPPGTISTRGILIEEHHGGVPDDLRATRAVVRRIRLVTEDYRNVSGVTWEPVVGTATYEDLARTPPGFSSDLERGGPVRQVQTGLLVDLELTPLARNRERRGDGARLHRTRDQSCQAVASARSWPLPTQPRGPKRGPISGQPRRTEN